MENNLNTYAKISEINTETNTVSMTLHCLQEIQIDMMKTLQIFLDKNNYSLDPISVNKQECISKKLDEIKVYLETEVENISDLIFSLKEVIVSDE